MSTTATATPPVVDAIQPPSPPEGMMEVVMTLDLEGYRSMGEDIAKVRQQLDLPSWSTPTEVIAAALRQQAGSG